MPAPITLPADFVLGFPSLVSPVEGLDTCISEGDLAGGNGPYAKKALAGRRPAMGISQISNLVIAKPVSCFPGSIGCTEFEWALLFK
jgi:hypothetical protein